MIEISSDRPTDGPVDPSSISAARVLSFFFSLSLSLSFGGRRGSSSSLAPHEKKPRRFRETRSKNRSARWHARRHPSPGLISRCVPPHDAIKSLRLDYYHLINVIPETNQGGGAFASSDEKNKWGLEPGRCGPRVM